MTDTDRLQHILTAIADIELVEAEGREAFLASRVLQNAALYGFIVIGEAANEISDTLKQAHPEIAWRRPVRYRNFVAHAYASVSPPLLWGTIARDIPLLKQQITALLAVGNS